MKQRKLLKICPEIVAYVAQKAHKQQATIINIYIFYTLPCMCLNCISPVGSALNFHQEQQQRKKDSSTKTEAIKFNNFDNKVFRFT